VGVGALVAALYLTAESWGGVDLGNPLGQVTARFLGYFVASVAVLGLAWTLGLLVRTWRKARLSRRQEVLAVEEQRLAQRTVVVEQERNRIARDMHDVVAHSLAVVIAQADGARYARANDPGAVDTALSTISATAREALGDVRVLLTQLRRDESGGPQPVLADLDRFLAQMRAAGLSIDWTETGHPLPLGSGAQLAVYRIIQEALTNALRHGDRSAAVRGALEWEHAGVIATIENRVLAAEPSDAESGAATEGHGLPGMRERALLTGGSLSIDSSGGRFTVRARIPATAVGSGPPPTSPPPTTNKTSEAPA
jgi:signal transduction histidine kinase